MQRSTRPPPKFVEYDWYRWLLFIAVFVTVGGFGSLAIIAILDIYGSLAGMFSLRDYIIYAGVFAGWSWVWMSIMLVFIVWWNQRGWTQHNLTLRAFDFFIQAFVVWGVALFSVVLLANVIGISYTETFRDPYVQAGELCDHLRRTLDEQGAPVIGDCDAVFAAYATWKATDATTDRLATQDGAQYYGSRALDQATRVVWWVLNLEVIVLGALLVLYFGERFYKRTSSTYVKFAKSLSTATSAAAATTAVVGTPRRNQ